jgi:hypothetical protein
LQRSQSDFQASKQDAKRSEADLIALRQQYRDQLSAAISLPPPQTPQPQQSLGDSDDTGKSHVMKGRKSSTNFDIFGSPSKTASNTESSHIGSVNANKDKDRDRDKELKSLLASYTASEKQLLSSLDKSNAEKSALKEAFRTLYDKYRAALEAMDKGKSNCQCTLFFVAECYISVRILASYDKHVIKSTRTLKKRVLSI